MKLNLLDPTRTPTLAAFALGEPIRPLGHRRDGRPIFPIAGGAPDDPPPSDDPPKNDPPKDEPPKYTPPSTQDELNRIIGERVARERAKFADYDEIKAQAAAHKKTLEDAMTEQERAVAQAKDEGKAEALTAANTRLIGAEARALAAEARFRNPGLAVRAIDLAGVTVNAEGEVDKAAITAKLKELSDAEPYLVDDGKKAPPKPDRSQGGGGGGDESPSVNKGREMFENRRGKKTTA